MIGVAIFMAIFGYFVKYGYETLESKEGRQKGILLPLGSLILGFSGFGYMAYIIIDELSKK